MTLNFLVVGGNFCPSGRLLVLFGWWKRWWVSGPEDAAARRRNRAWSQEHDRWRAARNDMSYGILILGELVGMLVLFWAGGAGVWCLEGLVELSSKSLWSCPTLSYMSNRKLCRLYI